MTLAHQLLADRSGIGVIASVYCVQQAAWARWQNAYLLQVLRITKQYFVQTSAALALQSNTDVRSRHLLLHVLRMLDVEII